MFSTIRFGAMALVALALWIASPLGTAARTPPAQSYVCVIVINVAVYTVDPNGEEPDARESGGGSGEAGFDANNEISKEGPLDASLTPNSLSATFKDGVYGDITTKVDIARTKEYYAATGLSTTVVTNNEAAERGERFPATGTIRFYATATVSSREGTTYRSRVPFELANNDLQSFGPFVKESFVLQKDVEFYDVNDPVKATAFTIYAGKSKVTLNGQ